MKKYLKRLIYFNEVGFVICVRNSGGKSERRFQKMIDENKFDGVQK